MSVKQASRTRWKKAGKCSGFDWKACGEDECNVIAGYTLQCSPLTSHGGTRSRHFSFTISTIEIRWAELACGRGESVLSYKTTERRSHAPCLGQSLARGSSPGTGCTPAPRWDGTQRWRK